MLRDILAWLFDKLPKLRKRFISLKLPRFLNPIDSNRQLILWLMIVFSLVFVGENLIDWVRGGFPSFTWDTFKYFLWFTIIMGVIEEGGFRYVFRWWLGNAGLVIGTLLWVGFHQFNASPPPLYRLPGDILFGIFYIKLWRGKFWRLSFIIHPMWNIGILLWWQFVLPLLI